MAQRKARLTGRGRAALLWTLIFFAAGQAALGLYLNRRHPEMCDPNFTLRLRALRERMAEAPGRPLAVFIGSSRAAGGVVPDAIAPESSMSRDPVIFNFALVGAGPIRHLMTLRRLCASGLQPDWLFLEVWAPGLPQIPPFSDESTVFGPDVYWPDITVAARLYGRPWKVAGTVLEARAAPAIHYRLQLLTRYAHELLPYDSPPPEILSARFAWCTLDRSGWLRLFYDRPGPEQFARELEGTRRAIQPLVAERFRISPVADKALRSLLDECRARRIRTALFLMPEHSAMRGWYLSSTRATERAYLGRLRDEYGVPVIDAREWLADEDFVDSCHLLPRGARHFSERFGRVVYRPLLAGQSLPHGIQLLRTHNR
jgi:hypothetical protein